ncbi:unnamed protein product [Arabis nemorensis]|uniref:Protein kinase domain-containing protein n=1 Tax=Arabis nemorensis TaxID=586526 RepID=A0A565BQ03_9BRAS|nr:unnamed protein product [Arabis nemorensis]
MAEPDLYFEKFLGEGSFSSCYGTRVKEIFNDDGHVEFKIPMEYASGGSLRSFMDRFKDRKLPDPMIRDFTRMLLEGLATIHGQGYVHCDLKPGNILVFPSCVYKNGKSKASYELKISDFGMSKRDGDSNWWQPHRPFAGTPIYMSPESVSYGETRTGLDLWSLGCVVLEMYTGKRPWWHKNYYLKYLKNGYTPLIPRDLPCDARLFVMACFALEVEERKDALTLLRHRFLHGYVNKIIEPPVNVTKTENPKNIALELEKIRQRLSEIRSILSICVYIDSCGIQV